MNFKDYRESKRLSPTEAAKQLNVSYETIWRWENGKATPTRTQQLRIQDWSEGAVMPEEWKIIVNFEGNMK
jgi:transcriptional regulator with XRE-family HTH domain